MRYLSVCSGIEAATCAWHSLGWEPAAFSEIDPFPRAVLAHHYPEVPLHGDFTTIQGREYGTIDLLVGGTPCQSFSVAGLRAGLSDPRGNLMLEFGSLARRVGAKWLVWENVPGVLSSNGGRDFGSFLGMLGELGYGFAYRVLDAQYFGVAQRRRRVFVVGYLGDWRCAAAVLFERHSLQGHPAPSRKKGEGVAGTISSRTTGGGGLGTDFECCGGLQPVLCFGGGRTSGSVDVASCLVAKGQKLDFEIETFVTHSLRGVGFDASEDGTGRGTPIIPVLSFDCKASGRNGFSIGEIAPTLRSMGHANSHQNGGGQVGVLCSDSGGAIRDYVALSVTQDSTPVSLEELSPALKIGTGLEMGQPPAFTRGGSAVRRLTPRECERLQGFPDDYTLIPHGHRIKPEKLDLDFIKYQMRGNPKHLTRADIDRLDADGPRYKALGNSMAVPVMRWIGKRIAHVDALSHEPSGTIL